MYPAALIFSTWIWVFVNSRLFGGAPHSTQAASRAWGGIMRDLKTTSRGCMPTLRPREGRGQSLLSLLIMLTSPSEGRIHPFRGNAIAPLKITSATNTVWRALTFISPPSFMS